MKIVPDLIDSIYDIPLGRATWEETITALKEQFNAALGFMLIDRPNQPPVVVSTIPSDDDFWLSYGEYYYSIDPWNALLSSNRAKAFINTCTSGRAYMPEKEYFKTEYFNDFWKPNDLYFTAGGHLITKNNISILLAFPRGKVAGQYTDEEAVDMTFYARHIVRAIELEGVFGNSLPKPIYEDALASSYGLTAAESRIVHELFKSGTLPNVAKNLHRSYHTVRNQMKSVFQKTDTVNQVELLRLLITNEHPSEIIHK